MCVLKIKRLTMKKLFFIISFALVGSFLNAASADYSNVQNWEGMCKQGASQSPINIQTKSATKNDNISFLEVSKQSMAKSVEHGSVEFQRGYSVVGGVKYSLKGLHFHSPTEHTINNNSFDLEGHFVHKTNKGEIAVIGVMFKEGAENKILAEILAGNRKANFTDLIPANSAFYNYSGSLTTPPCSEPVNWVVMEELQEASKEQIAKFKELLGAEKTNRPVMPINNREVTRYSSFSIK